MNAYVIQWLSFVSWLSDGETHFSLQNLLFYSSVGVSYYDCSVRQLHVLEVWEEDCSDFTLINMGMYFRYDMKLNLYM